MDACNGTWNCGDLKLLLSNWKKQNIYDKRIIVNLNRVVNVLQYYFFFCDEPLATMIALTIKPTTLLLNYLEFWGFSLSERKWYHKKKMRIRNTLYIVSGLGVFIFSGPNWHWSRRILRRTPNDIIRILSFRREVPTVILCEIHSFFVFFFCVIGSQSCRVDMIS